MPTLILFIDALPYDDLSRLPRLAAWPALARLRPGFGYSINLHGELFAGKTPDQLGFFGEWALDGSRAPGRRYRRVLPLLDRMLKFYVFNRGLQTLLTRRYRPGRIMPNLPLGWLGDFSLVGEKVDSPSFPAETLFSRHPRLQRVPTTGLAKGSRDAAVTERAAQAIAGGADCLYVPLIDLDGIGHGHRRSGPQWAEHLGHLDEWVDLLAEGFLARHPDGQVYALSDHGMADVHGAVKLELEAVAGRPGAGRYHYFSDSTLLRVWVHDPALGPAIAGYLQEAQVGRLIDHDERRAWGISDERFGDFIAVLDEGLCFKPSTFARNIPAAMHGYHPEVSSQHAVLAARGAGVAADSLAGVDRTLHVHDVLERALSRSGTR